MARKKIPSKNKLRESKPTASEVGSPSQTTEHSAGDTSEASSVGFFKNRTFISVLICLHFAALLASLASNMSPSFVQGKLQDFLSPYLVTTAQDYGAVPIELTHADPMDFPAFVQVHRRSDPKQLWQSVQLPAVAGESVRPINWTRSRWANISRFTRLIAEDFPDSEILSEIALSILNSSQVEDPENVDGIRIVAPHIPDFDEFEIVMLEGEEFTSASFQDQVVYSADVVRSTAGEIGLVPFLQDLRTSKSSGSGGEDE